MIGGRATNVAFMGNHTRITVQTDAGILVAIRFHGESDEQSVEEEMLDREVHVWWDPRESTVVTAGDHTDRTKSLEEVLRHDVLSTISCRGDGSCRRLRPSGPPSSLGGITVACNALGQASRQGGTFNWMTWGDHYIDTQLKAIEASDKIVPQISELAGNAEGFAKLKEVKGQLDQISGDALWVPDAYYAEGLIEPFDINELKVSSQLYSFARTFPIWTKPEGYLGYPFGWSPISIYYNVAQVSPAPDSWAGPPRPEVQGPHRHREPARRDRRVHGQGRRLRRRLQHDRRPARDRQGATSSSSSRTS